MPKYPKTEYEIIGEKMAKLKVAFLEAFNPVAEFILKIIMGWKHEDSQKKD